MLYSTGRTVERSLVSNIRLPCCTICFRGYLIIAVAYSSECFLALIATIVVEVRCCYSAHWFNVGGSDITPPSTEIVVQMLKQAGKHTRCPERVVHATGSGGTTGGATAGVASAAWLKVELGCDRSWMDWNIWSCRGAGPMAEVSLQMYCSRWTRYLGLVAS
jgi:hypothetical protein